MRSFVEFIGSLPPGPLTEAVAALYEASEGDARKYMKKVLVGMGLGGDMAEDYGENWAEAVFNKLRADFVRQGCDVFFLPGIARIAYGELDYDSDDEDTQKTAELRNLVKFITTAHKGQFTRNLERIDVVQQGPQKGMKVKTAPLSLGEIHGMFSREQRDVSSAERQSFIDENGPDKDNGYKIVELTDFPTANKFYKYTVTSDPHTAWCYLEDEETFDSYRQDGNRLYLALKPGFETLKPGQPGYGNSMIGFDMGPVDDDGNSELCVATDRYNHGINKETGEQSHGDQQFDQITLSKTLGFPVWKRCPGYSVEDVLAHKDMKVLPKSILVKLFPTYGMMKKRLDEDADGSGYRLLDRFNIAVGKTDYPPKPESIKFSVNNAYEMYAIVDKEHPDEKVEWFQDFKVSRNGVKLYMYPRGIRLLDKNFDPMFGGKLFKFVTNNHNPIIVQRFEDNKANLVLDNGQMWSEQWLDSASMGNGDYAIVENNTGLGKLVNVIDKDGHSLIGGWATGMKMQRINPRGAIFKVTYKDGSVGLFTDQFAPFSKERYEDVWFDDDNRDMMVVKRGGKYAVVDIREPNFDTCAWFDRDVDLSTLTYAGTDWTPYVLGMVGGKYNWYSIADGSPLYTVSFDKVQPLDNRRYFWIVRVGDKVNLVCSDNHKIVSERWFDADSNPEPTQNPMPGFKLDGRPVSLGVRKDFGKIYPG